jgi:RNA polymerase sigma factor (sigma-70 family)
LETPTAKGSEQEWEALVQEHQTAVFRLAYLFCGDPDEAEDVTQETFIHAYRALASYDRNRPIRPWLLGIAANLARNRLRGLGRYLAAIQRLVRGDVEHIAPTNPTSDASEEAREAWQAVRKLGLADQQVIYLRYYLELNEAELAAALKLPAGTVKSRLSRALARLRARLEKAENEFVEEKTRE